MTSDARPRRRVGLALGAGAARGSAHLGVLQAIEEQGIPIDCVAGTSIGSLIGAMYASGKHTAFRDTLLDMEWKDVVSYFIELTFPRSGLLDGKKIADFMRDYIADTDVASLPLPFRAVATDVLTGSEVVIDRGPVIDAVRASIAFPGIFTPAMRDAHALVDGGLVNPVPVSVVREMGADVIIAVDINHGRVGPRAVPDTPTARPSSPDEESRRPEWYRRMKGRVDEKIEEWDHKVKAQVQRWTDRSDAAPSIFDVLGNTIRIMEAQIADTMLAQSRPEVLIRPAVGHISFLEFNRAAECVEIGYRAARVALEGFRERLSRPDIG